MVVELGTAEAEEAIRTGLPLLQRGGLSVEAGEIAEELRALAGNLAETAELGTPAQDSARRLAAAPIDPAPFLPAALAGDREAIEREAFRYDVDPRAFGELLELALQPALWEAAAQLASLTDIDRWERGYCPVCGAWPALAELTGPERRRVLRCVRCGAGWSWLILLCPYCGNDDHRSLGSLAPRSEEPGVRRVAGQRVDTCERCRGYVKAIASIAALPAVRLQAEDVASLALDLAAREAGYRRPGEVDPATAGIPRLVREGRSAPASGGVG